MHKIISNYQSMPAQELPQINQLEKIDRNIVDTIKENLAEMTETLFLTHIVKNPEELYVALYEKTYPDLVTFNPDAMQRGFHPDDHSNRCEFEFGPIREVIQAILTELIQQGKKAFSRFESTKYLIDRYLELPEAQEHSLKKKNKQQVRLEIHSYLSKLIEELKWELKEKIYHYDISTILVIAYIRNNMRPMQTIINAAEENKCSTQPGENVPGDNEPWENVEDNFKIKGDTPIHGLMPVPIISELKSKHFSHSVPISLRGVALKGPFPYDDIPINESHKRNKYEFTASFYYHDVAHEGMINACPLKILEQPDPLKTLRELKTFGNALKKIRDSYPTDSIEYNAWSFLLFYVAHEPGSRALHPNFFTPETSRPLKVEAKERLIEQTHFIHEETTKAMYEKLSMKEHHYRKELLTQVEKAIDQAVEIAKQVQEVSKQRTH